jgi:hypothetical protein
MSNYYLSITWVYDLEGWICLKLVKHPLSSNHYLWIINIQTICIVDFASRGLGNACSVHERHTCVEMSAWYNGPGKTSCPDQWQDFIFIIPWTKSLVGYRETTVMCVCPSVLLHSGQGRQICGACFQWSCIRCWWCVVEWDLPRFALLLFHVAVHHHLHLDWLQAITIWWPRVSRVGRRNWLDDHIGIAPSHPNYWHLQGGYVWSTRSKLLGGKFALFTGRTWGPSQAICF